MSRWASAGRASRRFCFSAGSFSRSKRYSWNWAPWERLRYLTDPSRTARQVRSPRRWRQKSVLGTSGASRSIRVRMSIPSSSRPAGSLALPARRIEAETSRVMAAWSVTLPAGRRPGHHTIQGTRIPPSKQPPLYPENGAMRAVRVPPLSLQKITSVSSTNPFASSARRILPIPWSSRSFILA